jgi:hypothetical protein
MPVSSGVGETLSPGLGPVWLQAAKRKITTKSGIWIKLPRSVRQRGKILKPSTIGVDYNKPIYKISFNHKLEFSYGLGLKPAARTKPWEVAVW